MNTRTTLMARPTGTLVGRGVIRYEPNRNATLGARETRVATEFYDFIRKDLDVNLFSFRGNDAQYVSDAQRAVKEAAGVMDVVEMQLAGRRIAKLLLNAKGGNHYRGQLERMARYRNQYHYWAVANVDPEIARYYRWWVNRELMNITMVPGFGLQAPSHMPHITITRGVNDLLDVPKADRAALWGKYEGEQIEFTYKPEVRHSGDTTGDRKAEHWFIVVDAPKLRQIREEFDIPTNWHLHLTVGKDYFV